MHCFLNHRILLPRCRGSHPFYTYTHTAWMVDGLLLYYQQIGFCAVYQRQPAGCLVLQGAWGEDWAGSAAERPAQVRQAPHQVGGPWYILSTHCM